MPYVTMIAKMVLLLTGMQVRGSMVGVGAYYAPGLMQQVCERRVQENWTPGLQCDWPCLVSAIEQEHLGELWLVDMPGGSMHV